jgi:hypothetical protein
MQAEFFRQAAVVTLRLPRNSNLAILSSYEGWGQFDGLGFFTSKRHNRLRIGLWTTKRKFPSILEG